VSARQLVLPVLTVLGAAAVAGPVLAAVAAIVHALTILAIVLLGLGAAGRPGPVQAHAEARPLPQVRPRAFERDAVHLHFHGVSAEDVTEIICRELP
jgi:hypothetical protein